MQAQALSWPEYNSQHMKTVGSDKRVNYYQLDADEVVADLHSHRMGLTHAESTRRLVEHGPNALPFIPASLQFRAIGRQPQAWLIGLLLIGAVLSLSMGNLTAVAFVVIAGINAIGLFWQIRGQRPAINTL